MKTAICLVVGLVAAAAAGEGVYPLRECVDDVEERPQTGQVSYHSRVLEVGGKHAEVVGLRWGVGVPSGASVTVELTAAGVSDLNPTVLHVFRRGHPSDIVTWEVPSWSPGSPLRSPDLKRLFAKEAGSEVALVVALGSPLPGKRSFAACDAPGGHGAVLVVGVPGAAGRTGQHRPACPPRVRRPYSSLSQSEREAYAAAVQEVHEKRGDLYGDFVRTHLTSSDWAHSTSAFLPWHRWFLLQFENALRELPGRECMTIPFWDLERDAADQQMTTPMKKKTFGDLLGHPIDVPKCLENGIGVAWRTIEGGCVERSNTVEHVFLSEVQVAGFIPTLPHYFHFAQWAEDEPHNTPHDFLGGHMGSMHSPEDPIFFLLHSNVDRIYALWQDYHGYDELPKSSLGNKHYYPNVDMKSADIADPKTMELDSQVPVGVNDNGDRLRFFQLNVTIRDLQHIHDLPGGYSYSYGPDCLAKQLGTPAGGTGWNWFLPGCPKRRTHCGDGTVDTGVEECDDGNRRSGDGCSAACKLETKKVGAEDAKEEEEDDDDDDDIWVEPGVIFTEPDMHEHYTMLKREYPDMPLTQILLRMTVKNAEKRH